MNNDRLGRFLNGDADDEEFKRCETLLEDVQTIVDEEAVDKSDPLIASLRAAGSQPLDDDDKCRQLVQRIGGVVAQQVISRDDLERLLDAPHQADELGRIGRYRVVEFIAAGGMGLVFKAEDAHLNRLVCIKIMHPALAMKPDARVRFERESRAAAQLRSERIVTLLDIGVQRDLPYIVMQLLDGESLRSKLSREGKLSADMTVHYMMQIAEGLSHAHAMGILHRDIKPDNIWITATGDIKLLDFGLARPLEESGNLTTTGGLIGTPQYMSPEQIQGQTLDARSDLFSLGVVLFEMLTGTLPFQKNNLFSTMIAITNDSVDLPAIESASQFARDMEVTLLRLLKKNPDERIQSAQELLDQLSQIGAGPAASRESTLSEKELHLTFAGHGYSHRARHLMAGVAGGLLAMLLLILIMQATDKGTLLVRSNDPQVEIRVAQEKVHVKDPLSGKSFEIQIGKTRLPGGVYQLDMNDATSGLTFSSSTIAIRRGETVIVEVELQPTEQVATKNGSKAPAESGTEKSTSVADDSQDKKNDDPSFQLKAREEFAHILASLPAQSIDWAAEEERAPSISSLNAGQAKLKDIDQWSVDTNTFVDRGARYNCDQTLLATVRENTTQIWDKSLKLKYTLRTPQMISQVIFDNKYPNLVAVSSFVSGEPKPLDGNSVELTVWRLGADYAELIHRFPCKGMQFAWDQGYRLFHEGREGLAVFRLDENKDYELHVPHGTIFENAISTNGRFLATQNGANIDVWDLQRGEFAFTSLNNSRVQWNLQGERAAFFSRNRTAFEIWDLEKQAIDDRIELTDETDAQNRLSPRNQTGMRRAVIALESTFQRVAWLSPQGKLSIRNLRNNREDSLPVRKPEATEIKTASLRWAGSSLVVETDQASFVWKHDKSDVQGTLTEQKPAEFAVKKQGIPLEFTHAVGTRSPVLLWYDEVARDRNSTKAANARDRESELYLDAFDVRTNQMVRQTPFSQMRTASYSSFSNVGAASDILGPPYISLDGRFATLRNADASGVAQMVTFADPQPPKSLDLPGVQVEWGGWITVWDKSSRFAFITGTRGSFQAPIHIYDTQTSSFIDLTKVTLPTGRIIEALRSQNGFVMVTRQAPPATKPAAKPTASDPRIIPSRYSGELEVWRVDPETLKVTKSEVATKFLAKAGIVESITATDRYLFVSMFVSQEETESPKTVRKYYRVPLDEDLGSHVECVTVPQVDELFFSSSGAHLVREARDAEVVSTGNDPFAGRRLQYRTKGPSSVYHAVWSDIAKDLGDVDSFEKPSAKESDWSTFTEFEQVLFGGYLYNSARIEWHPDQEVVAWVSNGNANFFTSMENRLRKTAAWTGGPLLPSDMGWVRADHNEVQFFEVSGVPIGKLMFDPFLENLKPTRPRWRLTDGAIATQCSTEGLAISYQQGNRFYCESIDEFERARPEIKLPRVSITSRLEPPQ